MRDLDGRVEKLRELTAPPLDNGDIDRIIAGGQRRHKIQRARRAGTLAVTGVALALLVGWLRLREPAALTFSDGSTVALADSHSEVSVTSSSQTRTEVAVRRGGGRFDVKRNPGRLFRVTAGAVTVDVLGTRFSVRHEGDEVHVSVERGRVRVRSPRGEQVLGEGEASAFPERAIGAPIVPARPVPLPELEDPPSPEPMPAPPPQTVVTPPPSPSVPSPSAADSRLGAVRDAPDALLHAADVARSSGHPKEAVRLLERILKRYAADPRAQLAAFTLGRLYFDQLHQPRAADGAFARARALAPNGPLAEDALFHQIECADNSGDPDTARARAREYLRLYPTGSHVRSAQRIRGPE